MKVNTLPTSRTQTGQALIEFLVVALALLPLFLLIPVIAKYQSIAQATQMASRYAAFDAPIKTGDVAGDFKANQNLFWRTPHDKPLIANFSDVTVTRSQQDGHDGQTLSSKPGPFLLGFGGAGIGSAQVSVTLANLPSGLQFYEPFDQINLMMKRSTSVLADGWTGKDPADVEQKFAPYAPGLAVLPSPV